MIARKDSIEELEWRVVDWRLIEVFVCSDYKAFYSRIKYCLLSNVVYCLIIVLMKADTSFPLLQSSSNFVNKQLKLRNNDVNILTKANR